MFDLNKLKIRPATLDDVDFIATTIIEAEKSSVVAWGLGDRRLGHNCLLGTRFPFGG